MGAGVIIENNIANGCSSIWQKVPNVPELPVNLQRYNKGFVSFVSLVGAYALVKGSVWATKKALQLSRPKPVIPTKEQMQTRYGSHSWALIVDCKENQEYCVLLAKRGFKLILCGQEDDIKIAQDRVFRETGNINFKIEPIIVDWEKQAKNLEFYKQLQNTLKDHDISIIVMPTIRKQKTSPTSEQKSPVFEHVYLITRFFGPKLKWRPTSSAIIIPSHQNIDKVDESLNGVTRAVQSGVDAFGRTMQYELKGEIDIVIARGSAQNALAGLGKLRITH